MTRPVKNSRHPLPSLHRDVFATGQRLGRSESRRPIVRQENDDRIVSQTRFLHRRAHLPDTVIQFQQEIAILPGLLPGFSLEGLAR